MALSKVNFNSLNLTPTASKTVVFNSNNNGIEAGDVGGALSLLSTVTASSSATIDFTSNIDSSYKEYEFHFINIHPATDAAEFSVQFNAAGGSGFNETIMSTIFQSIHSEDDSSESGIAYVTANDQNNGTAYQDIYLNAGNGNDECICGTLNLYNPSSTTFTKNWVSRVQGYHNADSSFEYYTDAIVDTTTAIDEVSFKFSSGNIDSGVIKLYGVS